MDTLEMEKSGGDILKLKWSVIENLSPLPFLITSDVGMVNTPDGRGIVLVGVTDISTAIDGNEQNSTALAQWWSEKGKDVLRRDWTFLNITIKVAQSVPKNIFWFIWVNLENIYFCICFIGSLCSV